MHISSQEALKKLISIARGIVGGSLLLASLWTVGLWEFVGNLPRNLDNDTSRTQAIVVLTGGSERLNAAVELLEHNMAQDLLITGVGKGANIQNMLLSSGIVPNSIGSILDHIHLGYEALDTRGNAQETAKWMQEHQYTSLRLVTASYHLPRSILEFQRAMPGITVIAHPVFPQNVILDEWWESTGSKKLLISEYNKYLASKVWYVLG